MLKKIRILTVILALFSVFTLLFITACGGGENYGKLTVYKIENLAVGESQEITFVFSNEKYKSEIEYSFEGNDIKIENGVATALVGGKKVMVTAKTQYHETTFAVSTAAAKASTVITNDVVCWLGYPEVPLDIYFKDESEKKSVVFEYDTSAMFIDSEELTLKPLKKGDYTVKVETLFTETQFNVTVYEITKNNKWNAHRSYRVSGMKSDMAKCTADTTVFIGDSFFDYYDSFFNNFYSIYDGKDALCLGVGASTSYSWENYVLDDKIFAEKKPKNIVINLGTNNMYDVNDIPQEAAWSMQRFLMILRNICPDSDIYLFAVAPRGYNGSSGDKEQARVKEYNSLMSEYCENREEITFIDVFEEMKDYIASDNIHPEKVAYKVVYAKRLEEAGCVIADKK